MKEVSARFYLPVISQAKGQTICLLTQVYKGYMDNVWLTHSCFIRFPSEIVVCIYDTFENNLGIKSNYTKYLKENCGRCPDEPFLH